MDTSTFNIRNFLHKLQPTKQKNKYYCPVCKGNDLEIVPETGEYTCFHNCDRRDIREALKPWAEVLEERRQARQQNRSATKKSKSAPKKKETAAPPGTLPMGELALARLSAVPTDIPQPSTPPSLNKTVRKALAASWCTPEEIKQTTVTIYDYGDNRKALRYECPCSKSDKGREKTFSVNHIDETGQVRWNKGNYTWSAYRQAEAIAAAAAVEDDKVPVILSNEGEKCVEAGRAERLAGISLQGTPKEEDWVCVLNEIKLGMGNTSGTRSERQFVLAHIQDNDSAGEKKAQTIRAAAARARVPFVAIDLTLFVPELCDKGDIADILATGMTGDELAKLILLEIERQRCEQSIGSDESEDEKPAFDPNNPESFYQPICDHMGLPFENCVTATAFDTWVYHREFSNAENWRVIDSAFFKWSDNDQYWQHQPDSRINTLIADAGEKAFKLSYSKDFGWRTSKPYGSNSHAESAFKYVRKRLERPEPLPTNTHLLGLRNCVVDLRTGQQMPHSKEYFLTNIIPYDYEPNKPCPEVFRQFVVESFGEDMLEVIRAFTSMFLDPTAPYGRFPHLIGQSGGGKGTLGRFWSSLFGDEGSGSAAHFADISSPEGRHQYLTGKRIFGFPDVGGYAEGVRAFYELVDNGAMSGRALFNPVAYSKQWYMRFWLASVDHLQIENAGDGWARRSYPIPVKSRTVKPDPDLRMKLEACKADVISWALTMPRAERERILLSPPASERAMNLALDAALYGDSTKSFVDLCLRPSPSADFVPHHQLHSWYTAYCREHGYTPLGMSKFISHLKTVLPRNFKDRYWSPSVDGKRQRIQAHWKYVAPLPNVFVSSDPKNENIDQNPLWRCLKSQCEEGGLADFEEFWQPEPPEPSPRAAVHPVQGTADTKNYPGQAETQSQSGCPPCPSVHPIDPDTKISDQRIDSKAISNVSSSQPQSEGGQNRTPWTPAPGLDSGLSTPPVDTLDRGGHPGQSHQDWIPANDLSFDPLGNAQSVRELLGGEEAGQRLSDLLVGWTEEQKSAVKAHLQESEIEAVRRVVSEFQKASRTSTPAATVNDAQPQFKVGSRVTWAGDPYDGAGGCQGEVVDLVFGDFKIQWTRCDGTSFERRDQGGQLRLRL